MRIAIDKSSFQTDHRVRGVGFYTERLIKALQKVGKRNQYIFFTRGEKIPKCDLLHYPYFDLFSLTLPFVKSVKTVVTVHDLTPLVFPDKFPKGAKGWIRYQIQRQSLRGVNAIITDSKNSKKDIVKFIGFPEKKIYVVPLASDKEFKKLEIGPVNFDLRSKHGVKNWMLETRKKYCLPEKFVLYVGDVNWNKNIPGLIKAFKELKTQNSKLKATIQNSKLVFVGKAFLNKELKETREILRLVRQLNLSTQIKFLGFVPIQDLVAIYNLASVYVQPSFYEGFGLPVLEAMACGTPVVCANTSSLPEVGGKAAVYVDPYGVDDIARGISEVLHYNDTYHCKKVEEGLKQASKFSWEKTARETIRVYEIVMTNN